MISMIQSKCGLQCNNCEWVPKTNCPGCLSTNGKPFWGECSVALCCINSDLPHCGVCKDFPCEKLLDFAYDSEHGDNGERIETLKKWTLEET